MAKEVLYYIARFNKIKPLKIAELLTEEDEEEIDKEIRKNSLFQEPITVYEQNLARFGEENFITPKKTTEA
jgi:hypothetical protein